MRLFILWLTALSALAQPRDTRFHHLDESDGLSNHFVSDVVQGPQGYLWIATRYGLNRYDGHRFKTFIHNPEDPASLPDNYLISLLATGDQWLWVGTHGKGVAAFDTHRETFVHYPLNTGALARSTDLIIMAMAPGRNGSVWLATRFDGLVRLDPDEGDMEVFRHNPAEPHLGPLTNQLMHVAFDDKGLLWIAHLKGLSRFDPQTKHFNHITGPIEGQEAGQFWGDRAYCSFDDGQGSVWIGSNRGLNRYRNGIFEHYKAGRIDRIAAGVDGNIWCAVGREGLISIDPGTGQETRYRHDSLNAASPDAGRVNTIFLDRSGLLWFGSEEKLSFIDETPAFEHFRHQPLNDHSLGGGFVNDFTEDGTGAVWVAHSRGLDLLERDSDQFQHMPKPLDGFIKTVHSGPRGWVWAGTPQGLMGIADKGADPKVFRHDPDRQDSLSSNLVSYLCDGGPDSLWVGTVGGLNLLDLDTHRFKQFKNEADDPRSLSSNNIKYIHRDRDGRIWVGSYDGLNLYEGSGFRRFGTAQGLSHKTVTCMADGTDAVLWIGTMAGLNRLEHNTEGITSFHEKDGLSHEIISGIVADAKGMLWISTGRGMMRFDPRAQQFYRFSLSDGLQDLSFEEGAAFGDSQGLLYFGGNNGFNRFDPAQVRFRRQARKVLLTDFLLFNRSVRLQPADSGASPAQVVGSLSGVRLDYREDMFALEFALPEFRNPAAHGYAYKLEGFDKDWVTTDARNRRAAYTRVEPGQYRFLVKGRAGDGDWSPEPTLLEIEIVPPFWKTTWFQGLMLLLLVVAGNLLYRGGRYLFLLISHWKKNTHIGPYKLLELVGKGGMGEVHRALDLVEKRIVALKVLSEEAPDEATRKRFINEGLICERVDHPNIIKIFARGRHEHRLYYAMEYCEGLTLRKVINETGMSIAAAVHIMDLLLDLLHQVHRAGVIHRDIKPENIMLTGKLNLGKMVGRKNLAQINRHLKVLDFGVSKFIEGETLTRTGELTGTMYYLPPEYLLDPQNVGPQMDFYALGVMLYEMLTFRRPFSGDCAGAVFQAILNQVPTPPSELNSTVPPALSDFILDLLEKDVDDRLSDYAAIRHRLDRVVVEIADALSAHGRPRKSMGTPTQRIADQAAATEVTVINEAALDSGLGRPRARASEPDGDTDWLADTDC